MDHFKPKLQVGDTLRQIFGFLAFLLISIFLTLSLPIYIFRLVVILLAKYFRPDLGEILGGVSSLFANDLFSGNPLRCNVIGNSTFSGRFTLDELKSLVLKKCVHATDPDSGELLNPKLQQYAVKWMGFTFWKNAFDTFHIDNHVYYHETLGDSDTPFATDEDVVEFTEHLLNTSFRPRASPWEFHLIPNYRNSRTSGEEKTILIFKVHHSLADGYGQMEMGRKFVDWPSDGMKMPMPRMPKTSVLERIVSIAMLPFQIIWEVSSYLGQTLRRSPWKVEDSQKEWYQYCAKSDPIPVSTVKEIKNAFGVTFTSVLVSSLSSAISQNFQAKVTKGELEWIEDYDQLYFFNTLPILEGRRNILTNQITGSLFHIPVTLFSDPVKRLRRCYKILDSTRKSVLPHLGSYVSTLVGAHFSSVGEFLIRNRNVSVGLTNLPGFPVPVEDKHGRVLVTGDFVVGGNIGCVGVAIMILSMNGSIRVVITAEKAVMSKEEARRFLEKVAEEINLLHVKAVALKAQQKMELMAMAEEFLVT